MEKTLLLIDGENFRYKVKELLTENDIKFTLNNYSTFNFDGLFETLFGEFKNIELVDKRYYAAKIHFYSETPKQSQELIQSQRKLKRNLLSADFNFVTSGHVRAHFEKNKPRIFTEKGVDVQIAVDMVSEACDKNINTIILCSSDSDLQPAVKECIKRGLKVIYLGFSNNPNKGLSFTCSETILFRLPEIIKAYS